MPTATTMLLRDPTVETEDETASHPVLPSLDGATIGIIWNGRPPGDALLTRMLEILGERHGVKAGPFHLKPYLGNIAPPEVFDDIAGSCDAVVTGVGDCGSCTSASVLDAITMARRGMPSAVIGGELFMNTTGRGMARIQGLPGFPLIHVRGYVQLDGIHDPAERDSVAEYMADNVENVLLKGLPL